MKRTKYIVAITIMLLSVLIPVVEAPLAWAAWEDEHPVGVTYFRGSGAGSYTELLPGHDGTHSMYGSVMPNHSDITKSGDPNRANTIAGGGAIGTSALKVSAGTGLSELSAEANKDLKEGLYNFLYDKYTNGSAWEKTGAALIAYQMTGKTRASQNVAWGDGARTVSSEVWEDLKARLADPTLLMTRGLYTNSENTIGVQNNSDKSYDAIDYWVRPSMSTNVDSWIFRYGKSGAPVYVLEIECANPLGRLNGLDVPTTPPKDYDLEPSASTDKTVVEPDDTVTVTNTVTNNGADPSDQTIWRLTKMVYDPSVVLSDDDKGARPSANDPCGSFVSGGRSACDTVQELTDAVFDSGGVRAFDPVFTYDVPVDTPVGTKICFTASVSRPTQEASPVWFHSTLQCIIVGKKPKMQVWGGDVRSGGRIDTSISTISSLGSTFGSWAEYGALSIGNNSGLASGAGLNNGAGDSGQSSWSKLTFANTGGTAACTFGCYDFTLSSSALSSQFIARSDATALSGTVDLNSYPGGTYQAGNVTLSGTTISAGKTIVLVSTGEVIIDGNIVYEDIPYTSIRSIPQVIIRAPKISIRGNTTQVDAWLLAVVSGAPHNGTLNTCSDVAADARLTANICNNPLVMNGPVVADTVYLRRTGGSGSQADERGSPAEIFNLRADAYLWAHAHGSGGSRVQTVYTKELSPRY